MSDQFLRVAEELGWDLEQQIQVLDDFVAGFGVSSRLDAWLAERSLGVHQRFNRTGLRDGMLRFVDELGAAGAFSHYLQRELRQAAEAALAAAAAEQAAAAAPVAEALAAEPPARRRWGWWPFRRQARSLRASVAS